MLFHYFDTFLLEYENRFKREHEYFRPVIQEVVEKYLDCGNPKCCFARIRCGDCGKEVFSLLLPNLVRCQGCHLSM
ncbi:MAG: transposase zinc-binding domain-containing protein [Candidatus Aminicenantes bacterium]|nr:transposase zinc-binding domain-containing protein [Candidatus Aminicenantes bacterium]